MVATGDDRLAVSQSLGHEVVGTFASRVLVDMRQYHDLVCSRRLGHGAESLAHACDAAHEHGSSPVRRRASPRRLQAVGQCFFELLEVADRVCLLWRNHVMVSSSKIKSVLPRVGRQMTASAKMAPRFAFPALQGRSRSAPMAEQARHVVGVIANAIQAPARSGQREQALAVHRSPSAEEKPGTGGHVGGNGADQILAEARTWGPSCSSSTRQVRRIVLGKACRLLGDVASRERRSTAAVRGSVPGGSTEAEIEDAVRKSAWSTRNVLRRL